MAKMAGQGYCSIHFHASGSPDSKRLMRSVVSAYCTRRATRRESRIVTPLREKNKLAQRARRARKKEMRKQAE